MREKLLKIAKKARDRKGFSLAETLTAVLILLMVSSIVAAGVPAAQRAYEKVVVASNAEVLLSTTISALRNELGTASRVVSEENGVTYLAAATGSSSRIYLAGSGDSDPEGTILLQRYGGDLGQTQPAARLVSKEASTSDLFVTYESVDCSNGIVTFENLAVMQGSRKLTSRDTLSIRVIQG